MVYHKVNIGFFVFYMIAMTVLLIFTGVGITPDRYVLILILGSLFIHKSRKFLIDWLPFLFILIAYDFLRSLAPILNPKVHFIEMIKFDNWLIGSNPTILLQNYFYKVGKIGIIDILSVIFYFLHFALPLAFAFIIWLKNRPLFKQFTTALLVLSYTAFFTYVIFPAAPPWLAEKEGYLQGVIKILDTVLQIFPEKLHLPTIYHSFNPNTVAAVPSLHAAYPFLVLFFAVKFFGKKGYLFIPYNLGVWFSLVYLGEHYIVDVLLGAIYATVIYFFTNFLLKLKWYIKL